MEVFFFKFLNFISQLTYLFSNMLKSGFKTKYLINLLQVNPKFAVLSH